MIVDVQGIETKVGDKVAFAGGGKGASEFYVGLVQKVNNASVTIVYNKMAYSYDYDKHEYVKDHMMTLTSIRKEGMFAILESK